MHAWCNKSILLEQFELLLVAVEPSAHDSDPEADRKEAEGRLEAAEALKGPSSLMKSYNASA